MTKREHLIFGGIVLFILLVVGFSFAHDKTCKPIKIEKKECFAGFCKYTYEDGVKEQHFRGDGKYKQREKCMDQWIWEK